MVRPATIVHGGAWDIPPDLHQDHRRGTRQAINAGWRVLAAGGSALDAVEAAIVTMEDDETFDAARGSFLNADGQVELDAGFVDGADLQVGAVAGVQFIRNPIRLGEAIAKVILARLALHHIQDLDDPQAAAQAAIEVLAQKAEGVGGVILLSPEGEPGWFYNTPHMACAYQAAGMDTPQVRL